MRQLLMVDARTQQPLCGTVEVIDGDDVVQTIEVISVDGAGACTGDITFPELDPGTYLFRLRAAGHQTFEVRVVLEAAGGCDYATLAAFEGSRLGDSKPLLFKLLSM